MNLTDELTQLREAIQAARKLQQEVHKQVATFPPEGRALGKKLKAAADKTLLNLELAEEALLKEIGPVH